MDNFGGDFGGFGGSDGFGGSMDDCFGGRMFDDNGDGHLDGLERKMAHAHWDSDNESYGRGAGSGLYPNRSNNTFAGTYLEKDPFVKALDIPVNSPHKEKIQKLTAKIKKANERLRLNKNPKLTVLFKKHLRGWIIFTTVILLILGNSWYKDQHSCIYGDCSNPAADGSTYCAWHEYCLRD